MKQSLKNRKLALILFVVGVSVALGGLSYSLEPVAYTDLAESVQQFEPIDGADRAPVFDGKNTHFRRISIDVVRSHIDNRSAIIIDARSPHQYRAGHLPGAINIPGNGNLSTLPQEIKGLGKMMPIIVYCQSPECHYADIVAQYLRSSNQGTVLVFAGGWYQWRERGYATEIGG